MYVFARMNRSSQHSPSGIDLFISQVFLPTLQSPMSGSKLMILHWSERSASFHIIPLSVSWIFPTNFCRSRLPHDVLDISLSSLPSPLHRVHFISASIQGRFKIVENSRPLLKLSRLFIYLDLPLQPPGSNVPANVFVVCLVANLFKDHADISNKYSFCLHGNNEEVPVSFNLF